MQVVYICKCKNNYTITVTQELYHSYTTITYILIIKALKNEAATYPPTKVN